MSECKLLNKAVKNGKYHACFNVYEDGTRPLIKKGEKFYLTTNGPFWKNIRGVGFKVETRSQKLKNLLQIENILSNISVPFKNKKALYENFYDMYHSSLLVNENGTRRLIHKNDGQRCPYATSNPFWMLPKDFGSKVETRMIEMRKKQQ